MDEYLKTSNSTPGGPGGSSSHAQPTISWPETSDRCILDLSDDESEDEWTSSTSEVSSLSVECCILRQAACIPTIRASSRTDSLYICICICQLAPTSVVYRHPGPIAWMKGKSKAGSWHLSLWCLPQIFCLVLHSRPIRNMHSCSWCRLVLCIMSFNSLALLVTSPCRWQLSIVPVKYISFAYLRPAIGGLINLW